MGLLKDIPGFSAVTGDGNFIAEGGEPVVEDAASDPVVFGDEDAARAFLRGPGIT